MIAVQVDVGNPGQFFACCGLLELAHRMWPGAEGWFEGATFSIRTTPETATLHAPESDPGDMQSAMDG